MQPVLRAVAALAGLALALAPAAGSATRFLAAGDFGVGGSTQRALGAAMERYEATHPATALVTLGDNDYTEDPAAFRRNWRASFGWLAAAGLRPAGTLGNHDVRVDGGRYEFDALGMPAARYTRSLGDGIELFVLDSNDVSEAQTAWLRRALARSDARWKIAVLHHPPYTCGTYRSHPGVVASWVPLFERYGVSLVLSGHDHNDQRFRARRGVTYVVHGAGASLYSLERCPAGYPRRVVALERRGFLAVVARERTLTVVALDRGGRAVDRAVLR
jgi:3',5'-cyclic AMP phosphodiesterase CpdA